MGRERKYTMFERKKTWTNVNRTADWAPKEKLHGPAKITAEIKDKRGFLCEGTGWESGQGGNQEGPIVKSGPIRRWKI